MSANATAAADKQTQLTSEPAGETDEEFLARMAAEDAASFADALNEWRKDRAAGGGEAKVVEAGGAFADKAEPQADGGAAKAADAPKEAK